MESFLEHTSSRRKFIRDASATLGGAILMQGCAGNAFNAVGRRNNIKVNAHLWVYASKFPPTWDVTPNLETVFADLSDAGIEGVELMESTLRQDDSVNRILSYVKKYNLPVAGSSYGIGFNFWDALQHKKISDDMHLIIPRLKAVGGKRLGISVGGSRQIKTEKQLDAQADMLKQVLLVCNENEVEANLHNHTYEIENGMHDLKGTLARIPEIKLGPDLNWLIRGGINPVDFINSYGKQIVYLHLRDQYADGKWTEYLGQGITDFNAIATALKNQKFNGDIAIELAFENGFSPVNSLKEDWRLSRAFVKKTFGW